MAGTTRDYLTRTVTLKGLNIELIDTAGWQDAGTVIEQQAQKLGREQTRQADLVLWCVEATVWVEQPEPIKPPTELKTTRPPTLVLTKADLAPVTAVAFITSAKTALGLPELTSHLGQQAREARTASLAPSLSRCKHHVEQALTHLRAAHHIVLFKEPAELLALELRLALDQLGEMVGAVYTDDLLDRIFSRFCIGK